MKPGLVGDEFLTRGHQHQKSYCAETYFCLSGKGVILMESSDGDIKALKLEKSQLVYVPPLWLHRSINIEILSSSPYLHTILMRDKIMKF